MIFKILIDFNTHYPIKFGITYIRNMLKIKQLPCLMLFIYCLFYCIILLYLMSYLIFNFIISYIIIIIIIIIIIYLFNKIKYF